MSSDQTVYELAQEDGFSDASPFLSKQMLYVNDNNAGSYNSNQVVFELNQLANSGRYLNWKEAHITIPLVIQINGNAAAVDFTAGTNFQTDFMVALKNSHTSLLHSVAIDVGNGNVVQAVPHISAYELFKMNTEFTVEEEDHYLQMTGYALDTPDSWSYRGASATNSVGVGMCNNCNGYDGTAVSSSAKEAGYEYFNAGMLKRQKLWKKSTATAAGDGRGHESVWGSSLSDSVRMPGFNYVENTATAKYIHYNAHIRLKDLLLFGSPDFPDLLKGAFVKITLTINQVFMKFGKNVSGNITFSNSDTMITSGGVNPLMISAAVLPTTCVANPATVATAPAASTVNRACGTAGLPLTSDYEVSLSIVKTAFTHARGAAQSSPLSACRLYIPAYVLNPIAEQQLLSKGQQKIKYNDVYLYEMFNVAGSFNAIVSSGAARAKRLIIVPFLSSAGNQSVPELRSPFSSAPATTAPIIINNFQVMLSGVAVYQTPLNYCFEQYASELKNTGVLSANQVAGLASGRVGLKEWTSGLFNYFVVDLRRRSPEDDAVLQNIAISGNITSPLSYDFKIFTEYEKQITLDLATGQRLE